MDIVYVVREGERNLPLMLSLRSVEAHLPHDRVWIVGHKSSWMSSEAHEIKVADRGAPLVNTTTKLLRAVDHPEVSEEFYLFHDDFFILRSVTQVPPMYWNDIQAHMSWVEKRMGKGTYYRSMEKTRNFLVEQGEISSPFSYDLHLPLPMVKSEVRRIWDYYSSVSSNVHYPYPLIRSLYGNMMGKTGVPYEDVKVRGTTWPSGNEAYVSTSSTSFNGEVGSFLRKKFPDPSRYEKPVKKAGIR